MYRIEFFIFLLSYILISITFLKARFRLSQGNIDLFDPFISFIGIFFLYAVGSGMRIEQSNYDDIGLINSSILNKYYVSCIIGLFGICLGGMINKPTFRTPTNLNNDRKKETRLFIFTGIVCLLLLPFYYNYFNIFNIPSYAERALASRIEFNSSNLSGPKEVFLKYLPLTLLFSSCTIIIFRTRSLASKIIFSIPLILYMAHNILGGWRGAVISTLLIPVVYYHYQVKKLKVKRTIFFGIGIYMFMTIMSFLRSTSDPIIMLQNLQEEIKTNGLFLFNLFNNTELSVGVNQMTLIRGIENGQTNFNYGIGSVNDILAFIPRSIYPERPLNLPETFVKTFYPETYYSGGGYGFFCIQEGYWSLGLIGVFIYMFLYGTFMSCIYNKFRQNISSISTLIYISIYTPLAIYSVRSGLISNFKSILLNLIPFLLLYLFIKIKIGRKKEII